MPIKIENHSQVKLPSKTEKTVQNIINHLPKDHIRGLDRIRFVDLINDPRVKIRAGGQLPALYHPKQGPQQAWAEIALEVLLPSSQPIYKRLLPRLTFKSNLAAILFSLIGQHYYITLRHSIKKMQLESNVRTYTEKQLKGWHEQNNRLRTRLFKPFQPMLEKWARSLRKHKIEK